MTLTIESCTPAVQPSQTRTTSKNPVRTIRWARRERASVAWNMKIRVSTDRSTARIAMLTRASLHASTQVATGGRQLQLQLRLRLRLRLWLRLWLRHDDIGVRDLEDVGVRDFVVEPKCDGHRWAAGAIDQDVQSPRLQGVEAGIGRQREQPGHLLPLNGHGIRIVAFARSQTSCRLESRAGDRSGCLRTLESIWCRENRTARWRRRRSRGRRSAAGACNPRISAGRADCRRWQRGVISAVMNSI